MTSDVEEIKIPPVIATRLPEFLKKPFGKLLLFEKKQPGTLIHTLLSEIIPIKQKIFDQKFILEPIEFDGGNVLSVTRGTDDYDTHPRLKIISSNSDGEICSHYIDKKDALTLAANLSIFLNEVHI